MSLADLGLYEPAARISDPDIARIRELLEEVLRLLPDVELTRRG